MQAYSLKSFNMSNFYICSKSFLEVESSIYVMPNYLILKIIKQKLAKAWHHDRSDCSSLATVVRDLGSFVVPNSLF